MSKSQETPPKEKRDHWLEKARVTAAEKAKAKENAKRAGVSLSEFQRIRVSNDIDAVIVREEKEGNPELVYQVRSIGNNLNQGVTVLNIIKKDFYADGDYDGERIQRSLDNLDATLELVDAALSKIME